MISKAKKLLKLILLVLLALPVTVSAGGTIEFLGRYQHRGWTEEHISVYRLELWRVGEKVFGFYGFYGGLQGDGTPDIVPWRVDGTVKGSFLVLKNDRVHFSFSGNVSENTLSGRWSDSMGTIDVSLQKLPATEIEPALLKAPDGSYDAWTRWAEQYLDAKDENNSWLSQYEDKCTHGGGAACLAAGNHSMLRGNRKRARQRYETGCKLNNAYCCLNIGLKEKALEILKVQCTGISTMENNFACQKLGSLAEESGDLMEARKWYRKGCNDSIPKVCPDLKRLENR